MIRKAIWKRHIRRMTAYLLAFMLSVSVFGVHAADMYTQADIDAFNDNVRFLSAFDLAETGKEAATTIKRGDFAAIMLKYLGHGEEFVAEGNSFSDVTDSKSPIYGMVQLGLLNGHPDGTFRPNDDVLSEQAVKVLVTALGYQPMAESMGGYPMGYIACARQIDLLKNASAQTDETLTYFNLVQMLVNGLSVDLMERNVKGGYSVVKNKTWLKSRLDVEKRKGVVTAAAELSLDGEVKGRKGTIALDGIVYDIDGDYSDWIGCYTEFYVNSEDEILYIIQQRTVKQELPAADLIEYSEKSYKAETESGKEKRYHLSQNSYILFNGAAADSLAAEEMCPKYGKVTLIDNNSDNRFDIVLIDSYDIYAVKGINPTDKLIYYKNSDGALLDFGGIAEEDLTVLNTSGKAVDFEQITSDSIIRVGFTWDKEKAKIIVSSSAVSGTVTSVKGQGKQAEINIDGVPYKVVSELVDLDKIPAGKTGTFYLDCEGLIAAVSEGDGSYSYGYLLNANLGVFNSLELMMFDNLGELLKLNCAAKINIDGLAGQNNEQVYSLLTKGTNSVVKQMIRFKRNGKGEVKEIDTPYNSATNLKAQPQNGESPESLRVIYAGTTKYIPQLHNFIGKVNVDADTRVFAIVGDDKKDYKVKRISEIPQDTNFKFEAYSDDESEFYAKLLFSDDKVLKGAGGSDGSVVGVIAEVGQGLNEDDEAVPFITFRAKLFDKDLFLEEELIHSFPYNAVQEPLYQPEIGDVVALQYSGDEANSVGLIYKPSENLFPAGSIYGPLAETRIHYIYGSVYSIEKGFISITQKDIAAEGAPLMTEVESYRLADFPRIFKCSDTGRGKEVTLVTAADLVDYKTAGENCSKVFVALEWQYPNIIIIYE